MKYSREQLVKEHDKGKKHKFLFFWGHQPSKDGSMTKSCFSQWRQSSFTIGEATYKTAEHYMMAEKANLFNDSEMLEAIINCNHPMEAKQFGRKVKGFDPELWNEHKYEIVKRGNLAKFSQHEEMKSFLLNTKNRVIVEASPRDRIWGIGMGAKNEKAMNPNLWRGQNLLGFALMEVRDELEIMN
ncbi:MAG: NADAR family protein [Flavobacteriaceae bacterium]|nr:NADAR family protein [Flavobacteriaceae bacterium]